MNNSWSHQALKSFIKDTLGCGCPDKVFEKIDIDTHRANGYSGRLGRIVVGDTLLIYIAYPTAQEHFDDSVEAVGKAGKSDRDSHQYNRFRLVVATSENNDQINTSDLFASLFGSDEKMHLHLINKDLLNGLNI